MENFKIEFEWGNGSISNFMDLDASKCSGKNEKPLCVTFVRFQNRKCLKTRPQLKTLFSADFRIRKVLIIVAKIRHVYTPFLHVSVNFALLILSDVIRNYLNCWFVESSIWIIYAFSFWLSVLLSHIKYITINEFWRWIS